ncbi:MAG: class I SAM-dependent methyltransferase [Verrucomicrobiae bacterium]|nr:class I SAM-dependent methyltransferase [Verrucomicrobiae bacterium]
MRRICESELMLEPKQAKAYAQANFDSAHALYPKLFARLFPRRKRNAVVLDLGCGPCDVTRRFAEANPRCRFHAVDGSIAMLNYAPRHPRIKLIHGRIQDVRLPRKHYDVILSSSVLHHMRDPLVLWQAVRRWSRRGTLVFVVDLRRPATRAVARRLVRKYAANEPPILRRDFYRSLLAAFTPGEVRQQLRLAELHGLRVKTITDRHLLVVGRLR